MRRESLWRLVGACGALAAIGGPLAASAAATTTVTFGYTGAAQEWTVPVGVRQAKVDVFGAQGGGFPRAGEPAGGLGGEATATIAVKPGSSYQINIGGPGGVNNSPGGPTNGDSGGGASDVRNGSFGLADRILVGGGGGGAGGDSSTDAVFGGLGGSGGGGAGGDGTIVGSGGEGGTQTAGGTAGANDGCSNILATPGQLFQGGSGGQSYYGSGVPGSPGWNGGGTGGPGSTFNGVNGGGGGGGGGYYGGGGGGATAYCTGAFPDGGGAGGGGGGGSSSGPAGTTFHPGVQSGAGQVVITPFYQTTLVAAPLVSTLLDPTARLTLTYDRAPLAGQSITFTKNSKVLCTATTNSNGVATCTPITIVVSDGFTATYTGSGNYLSSSGSNGLL